MDLAHNFLNEELATKFNLSITKQDTLKVMVANDDSMNCAGKCNKL